MVTTFDGLKDQIKAVASSPVSPTPVTADGRAADPFLALNQFCTYVRIRMYCMSVITRSLTAPLVNLYTDTCSPCSRPSWSVAHNRQIGWPCLVLTKL